MTMRLRLNAPRLDPNAPKPQPIDWRSIRQFADICLWVTAGLALLALTDSASAIMIFLTVSIIGLPLVLLMIVAVPIAAVLVPWRLAYGILRRRFDVRMSVAIAVPFAALFANAIDITLKYGPDGRPAAQHIVADQPALLPVTVPDHGIIAFRYDGPGWQWTGCPAVCRTLLEDGIATSVQNIGRDEVPFQAFYLADSGGTCAPNDTFINRSDTICEARYPVARTELRFDLVHEEAGPDQHGLNAIYHVTVQSGAMVQRSKMVSAQMPTGGGLFTPYTDGNESDGFLAGSREIRIVPEQMSQAHGADTWDEGMKTGFGELVLSLLR